MPILNEEQMLAICLELVSVDMDYFEGDAGMYITWYVEKDMSESSTGEEVNNAIKDLITNYNLEQLVQKGALDAYLDENNEVTYVPVEGYEPDLEED